MISFFRRPDPIRFVILFQGRAGSTMLKEHLLSHGEIFAHGEVFDAFPKTWPNQRTWLRKHYVKLKGMGRHQRAVGFKTKMTSLADPIGFRDFLHEHNIRVIHLERTNPVKLAVSVVRARRLREQKGVSNTARRKDKPGRLYISTEEFAQGLKRAKRYEELAEYVSQFTVPCLRISYERLLEEQAKTLNQIFNFLDVEPSETRATMVKITSDHLEDDVENVEELRLAFPQYQQYF